MTKQQKADIAIAADAAVAAEVERIEASYALAVAFAAPGLEEAPDA